MAQTWSAQARYLVYFLIPLVFFSWGLASVFIDMMIPRLKSLFDLSYVSAITIQFSFFLAYLIIPIPFGRYLMRLGYRNGIIIGLAAAATGLLIFYPAAQSVTYVPFLIGVFITACGIACLQVSANPMVLAMGPTETAASRLTMAQGFNALATMLGPLIASLGLLKLDALSSTELNKLSVNQHATYVEHSVIAVQQASLLIGGLILGLALLFAMTCMNLRSTVQPMNKALSQTPYITLIKTPAVYTGMIGIFLYVGAEVTIGSLLINYMIQGDVVNVATSRAAQLVAFYWGGAMIGRFVGTLLLRRIDPGKLLAVASAIAALLTIFAVGVGGSISAYALLAVGLVNSIHFPIIFSLTLKDKGAASPKISALLCTSIFGGAIIPLLAGKIADVAGLQLAFIIPTICYIYCVTYGLRHLKNATEI